MTKSTLPGDVKARLGDIMSQAETEARQRLNEGSRPTPEARGPRPKPSRPKTHAESFRDLDVFREEAIAGMPDDALCTAANVSVTAVLEWRRLRGIRRPRGRPRVGEHYAVAADVFGDGYNPRLHAVGSPVAGSWEPPEYVLRIALDYSELCRHLHFLHFELLSPPDLLAKTFGLRLRDIEHAIAVETAHLERVGVPCSVCGRPVDPAYGKACSARCRVGDP